MDFLTHVRTDLAVEAAQNFSEHENALAGVTVREMDHSQADIHIT